MVAELVKKHIDENAPTAIEQEVYAKQYHSLVERMEKAKSKYISVLQQIQDLKARKENYNVFIKALKAQEILITEFDEQLWNATVYNVTVFTGNNIEMNFKIFE